MHAVFIAPPFPSHLRAHEAVAERLAADGHRVTLVGLPEMAAHIRLPELAFVPVGARDYPAGSLQRIIGLAAAPDSLYGLISLVREMARQTDVLTAELPDILKDLAPDVVVADQMEAAGSLVAAHLGIPWISLAAALPVERDPAVPLPVLPFTYDPTPAGLGRNRAAERIHDAIMTRLHRTIDRCALRLGLPPRMSLADCVSPIASVSQSIEAFEFPRSQPAPRLHHVGPLRRSLESEPPLDLPFPDDRPTVFVSLGTLQGHRIRIFRTVAKACRRIGARCVVAHCGRLSEEEAAGIGADYVTDFLPQRAMLERSSVVVTHAGTNTVFDALATGTPMLAIPIAFDQPGTAARIVHHGVGLRLSKRGLRVGAVAHALCRLMEEPSFWKAIHRIRGSVAAAGGAARAAEIVLSAVSDPARARLPEPTG